MGCGCTKSDDVKHISSTSNRAALIEAGSSRSLVPRHVRESLAPRNNPDTGRSRRTLLSAVPHAAVLAANRYAPSSGGADEGATAPLLGMSGPSADQNGPMARRGGGHVGGGGAPNGGSSLPHALRQGRRHNSALNEMLMRGTARGALVLAAPSVM